MMPYSTLREIKLGYLGYRSSAETIEKFEEDMIDSVLFEPEFGAIQEWRDGIPLRRGGNIDDVANAALFFASDMSAYVSGQVLNVCGGMLT